MRKIFGVPLDTENPVIFSMFDRLNHAVFKTRGNDQVFSRLVDALMMEAVDFAAGHLHNGKQFGFLFNEDSMSGNDFTKGACRWEEVVKNLTEFLMKRSAKVNVQQLHPSAYTQNGQVLAYCPVDQFELHLVSFFIIYIIDDTELAVSSRVDIGSSGQNEGVEIDILLIIFRCEPNRLASGTFDCPSDAKPWELAAA